MSMSISMSTRMGDGGLSVRTWDGERAGWINEVESRDDNLRCGR